MTGRWLRLSYGYALIVAASMGYFLLRIPIQVTDSFTNILALDRPFGQLVIEKFSERAYLRPGLWAELKVVYDLSGGELFYWYRLTQVLQVALVVVLFVRIVRPRTAAGVMVLPLALAVLIGHHTFSGTVREAFPINTFLTIVVCCAVAAHLSFGARRWWTDVAAVVLFVVSALTVESGLLVGVILVGGYALGLRGVSRAAVGAVVLLGVGYFWARFGLLNVGTPTLLDRDAGFGFERYNGKEIADMFGARPVLFYAYNVLSAAVGVLFAEPRDGVWQLTATVLERKVSAVSLINVAASTIATGVILRFAWLRREAWRSGTIGRDDQIVLLFLLMLAANSAMSYAYTKDVIMSPTGIFFAAAFFVACRDLIERLPAAGPSAVSLASVVLLVLSVTWGLRQVGIHAALAQTATSVREQWAYIDERLVLYGYDELTPATRALKEHLQEDALIRHPARPPLREQWLQYFEVD